ncbi:MAG TPA: DUF4872 domain-containing protein [Actinomycetes bacterium]|nr:DUF4872 domain-containing protein [Actinomycetes bacterium]
MTAPWGWETLAPGGGPAPNLFRPTPSGALERQRGEHTETAAVARVLAELGVTHPTTGEPLSEQLLLGIGGGIGMAYFVFEYQDFTSLYVGGRINPHVLGRELVETVFERVGAAATVRQTASPKAAERQLRQALDAGHGVVATLDPTALPWYGLPPTMAGMMPQSVVVRLEGDGPAVVDLAPGPVPLHWVELATARAGVRPSKHRLVEVEALARPVDLVPAIAAGVRDTCRGMLEPPMRNFGVPGLAKWADLLVDQRDKKGWPTVFPPGPRLYDALTWVVYWIEASGTGGGAFRRMYAGFLDEAAGALGRPELHALAAGYRELAAGWTALAGAALPDRVPGLGRARQLLVRRHRLVQERGAEAATEVVAVVRELDALGHELRRDFPLDAGAARALLGELADRVAGLRAGEERAATALRAAVPAARAAGP